jgi:hypothetical protein
LDRRLGGTRAVLDTVVKRKIRIPIVQHVAQRYTD